MGSRRGASIVTGLLGVVAILGGAGCGRSDRPEGKAASDAPADSVAQAEATLEALRALPYAGSTPATEGEPDGVLVHDRERTCPGLRLVTFHRKCQADLIDEDGEVVRSWSVDDGQQWERALLLEDGGLLVVGADEGSRRAADGSRQGGMTDDARVVLRFDEDGNVVWRRELTAHHDIEVRPDGTLAVLAFERRVDPFIDAEIPVRDDQLLVLAAHDGSVLETRNLLEMVQRAPDVFPLQEIAPSGPGKNAWIDLFHSNSIEWMKEEALFGTHPLYAPNHVLVSFRNQDRVAIFDMEAGRAIWAWGQGEIHGPHDAQLLPGGTILLFDNGLGLKWSRALEVDPRTNAIVWEWHADPPESFFTRSRGSAQRLPNGNTLLAESRAGRAIEVGPDGDVVWEWLCPYLTPEGERYTIVRMQWVGE